MSTKKHSEIAEITRQGVGGRPEAADQIVDHRHRLVAVGQPLESRRHQEPGHGATPKTSPTTIQ